MDWEECGCILKQLQAAAHIVHSNLNQGTDSKRVLRTLLQEILSCLQSFRQAINTSFLDDEHEIFNQQESGNWISSTVTQEQLEQIADLLAATQICTRCKLPTIESIKQERMQTVQDELAAVAQINECFAHQGLPDVSSADKERLKLLITRLRNQEQQLTFQQGLKQAQQAFSGHDGDYSAENFAFGSTPFPTWMTLFTQRPVLDALARAPDTATLTVFGSSSGSLVLFATIALGINATGVEILPFLHNEAEQTRQALQVATHKCHFICADMLTVPVHKTSIVLLTSQCWDAQLYQQLQLKLETELQPGALVIDYKDALQSSSLFQMVQHLPHQRVSWTNSQSLFIFQRTIG